MNFTLMLTAGYVFRVNTHAEFLNEVFGTNYKKWMKSTWRYSKTAFAWFVRIDNKKRNNFINNWLDNNGIVQRHIGTANIWNGNPLNLDVPNDHRLVFEIIDTLPRKYIFQGVFLMDISISNPKEMVFKKVSNVFPIN